MILICLEELMNDLKEDLIYIPLYQRNYKWTNSENKKNGAGRLINDIIKWYRENENHNLDFNLGMITLYKNGNENMIQILDGQQRMITLSLIMKALGKTSGESNIDDKTWFKIQFERDPGFIDPSREKPRYEFLFGKDSEPTEKFVDIERMNENYGTICKIISQELIDNEELYKYIMRHVKVLYHQTTREPVDEFLNMNFNKTPFCAADYIKSNMIMGTVIGNKDDKVISISKIMQLWKNIEYVLYQLEDVLQAEESKETLENDMFQLIKQNYQEVKKNRMEVLFEDRYYVIEHKVNCDSYYIADDGNPLKKEYELLVNYYTIMKNLLEELTIIDVDGKKRPNYTAYSAYNLLCKKYRNVTFFQMFKDSSDVNETLYKEFNLTEKSYYKLRDSRVNVNQFMESMLITENTTAGNGTHHNVINRIANKNKIRDLELFEQYQKIFENRFDQFINLIEAGKKVDVAPFKEGIPITLKELLTSPKIRQIKVPQIQRDYVMGSSGAYLESYLCKIRYEELKNKSKNVKISELLMSKDTRHEEMDLKKLLDKIVFPDNRFDLPDSKHQDFGCYSKDIHFFEKKFIPQYVPNSNAGREHRFNELNEYLEIMDEKKLDAPINFRSYSNGSDLGKYLDLRNNIVEKLNTIVDGVKTHTYYDTNSKMNTSCIMGHLDDNGTFWVYDGQQRLTTSIILIAYALKANHKLSDFMKYLNKFSFEGRDGANQILKTIIMEQSCENLDLKYLIDDNTSYAIFTLWKFLNQKNENMEWNEYKKIGSDFILNCMNFELVLMEKVEDAEQLFIEMNEGLALSEDERYKAQLCHVMKILNYKRRIEFMLNMDNLWLNSFGSEKTEVRWIQYCVTMACFEIKGYFAPREWTDLTNLNEESLDLSFEAMQCFIQKKVDDIPNELYDKIHTWCKTLKFREGNIEPWAYKKKMYFDEKKFKDLINMFFKFSNDNDACIKCFSYIEEMRREKCGNEGSPGGFVKAVDTPENPEELSQVDKLEYYLFSNRQKYYEFDNIKQWEDNSTEYDYNKFKKDYVYENTLEIYYRIEDYYYISDEQKTEGDVCYEDSYFWELISADKIKNIYAIYLKNEDSDKKIKLYINSEIIQDMINSGILNKEVYDYKSIKQHEGDKFSKSYQFPDNFTSTYSGVYVKNNDYVLTLVRNNFIKQIENSQFQIEIGLNKIISWIEENKNVPNNFKTKIIELGIEKGFYIIDEGKIKSRMVDKTSSELVTLIEKYRSQDGEEFPISSNIDLMKLYKSCDKTMKNIILKEIAEEYFGNPIENNRFVYKTREYISGLEQEKFTELIEKYPEDEWVLKVIPKNQIDKCTKQHLKTKWYKYSGIYNAM